MRIRELSWTNYRRLPDGKITVRDHLVLIGPNDTGKSSILHALDLCLGKPHGQLTLAITERDFSDATVPVVLTVVLDGIQATDRAAFPDEITIGPPEVLTIQVDASIDPNDTDQKTVKRFFPDSGHNRAPSREQLGIIGFAVVPAVRSLARELGGTGGAVRSMLSALDLGPDAAGLRAAADGYRAALDGAETLKVFRSQLAGALSRSLPRDIPENDIRIVSEAELLEDPLSGVAVTIHDGWHNVPLSEQSDGIRALAVLTVMSMSHRWANILAVDEPETHLHASAQRSVATALCKGSHQAVIITHSPAVTSSINPMDIVTMRPDRSSRQLPSGAPIAAEATTVRHWSPRLIEPLTARRIVLVEGVADQIILERCADLRGIDLDRKGIVIFDLAGKGFFRTAYRLFGPPGFNIPLNGMLDQDARVEWAAEIGIPPNQLEGSGYFVCAPDLEGMYIDSLGAGVIAGMLVAGGISPQSLQASCGVPDIASITRDPLWNYCKGHKIPAAIAIRGQLDAAKAGALVPLDCLLNAIA